MVAVFCAFGGWALLLPVIPLAVIDDGGTDSLAGMSTGIFMAATVITQAFTPLMLRRFGYRYVLMLSGLMLGVPAIVHVFTFEPWVVLLIAVARGIGFGAVTVTESALVSSLVPPELIGRSAGTYGMVVGISQMVNFPLGLWVHQHFGVAVFWAAGILSLIGAVAAFGLPNSRSEAPTSSAGEAPANYARSMVPGFAIFAAATGFAAFSTFMAPATTSGISSVVLAVIGGTQVGARLFTGTLADRVGQPGKAMKPGLALVVAGVAVAAWLIWSQPDAIWVWSLVAASLFGLGFGAVQNEALLLMFHRLPRSHSSQASAIWNICFDGGTGVGAMLLGVVAAQYAYHGAFLVAALAALSALGITLFSKMGK